MIKFKLDNLQKIKLQKGNKIIERPFSDYQTNKNVLFHDIGYGKKVKGNHVFINSELGLYMDHFKGKRKQLKKSAKNDFRPQVVDATKNLTDLEYWKKI